MKIDFFVPVFKTTKRSVLSGEWNNLKIDGKASKMLKTGPCHVQMIVSTTES